MKFQKIIFTLITTLFLFVGCFNDGGSPDPSSDGSLILNLSFSNTGTSGLQPSANKINIKSPMKDILPPIDMTPASYDIQGTGPGSETFTLNNVTQNSVAINSLAAGAWAIAVTARNASGTAIGSGSTAVAVAVTQTTTANVTVRPLNGTGTMIISVSWPSGMLNSPSMTGILTPRSGSSVNVTFTISPDGLSASYAASGLSAGYYTLSMKLHDGSNLIWGRIESVRIVADQTTTGNIVLTADNLNPANEGNVNIGIGLDMDNPITITFTGNASSIVQGTDMTVTASTSETVDSYQWYLNGDPISGETSSSITIGSALSVANYRLDLVVIRGQVMSANGFGFIITE